MPSLISKLFRTNNIEFLVRNLPDKEEAALLLSRIRERLLKLVEHVHKDANNSKNDKTHNLSLKRLKKNYKPNNITESSPGNKYTSYSINKGEKIVFCLRSKKVDNKLVDLNTMMFVAIHELAHLMTKSIGHTTEFWDNMAYLLERAEELSMYTPKNYKASPVDYCGMEINTTPYKKFKK